ncbi:MAG: hypothetical protein P4L62_00660 [Candidatus Pacebacteria bacterium]|nr:hypothetical protein [Candidatus Paceibacterota bacterium]MDR3582860.1 hypothetical protein [Candidatus Paceibacterota bacterium]
MRKQKGDVLIVAEKHWREMLFEAVSYKLPWAEIHGASTFLEAGKMISGNEESYLLAVVVCGQSETGGILRLAKKIKTKNNQTQVVFFLDPTRSAVKFREEVRGFGAVEIFQQSVADIFQMAMELDDILLSA